MLPDQILRNRYKIIRPLKSGSFGTTYLAEDLDLPNHPLCVVKNLRQGQDPIDLEIIIGLFDKEAEALYRLGNEHNQIPKLFAHFQENGQFYLVQEYIDGHDLSQEIFSGNKLSEAKVIELLKEILEVLTIIHNKNIIHRDIKPQNLMRRKSDAKLVLIDFGTVKEISGLTINPQGQTEASIMIGTNGYMPGEQKHGYPKLCSDVYAVGMLGIYALTGVRPEELPKDAKTIEITWQHMAFVSPFLANILNKMVRYNFNERFPTASQALEALTTSKSTYTPSPSLPSSSSTLSSAWQANRKFWISVLVGAVLLFGVGLFFMTVLKRLVIDVGQTSANPEHIKAYAANNCLRMAESFTPSKPTQEPDWIDPNSGARFYDVPANTRTGRGTVVSTTGGIYFGDVKDGTLTCGKLLLSNGIIYVGEFNEDKYEGRGKLIFRNGCQHDGEFKKGDFQGLKICKI